MAIGSGPIGSQAIGDVRRRRVSQKPTTFDLGNPTDPGSILCVSQSVGRALVERFARDPESLRSMDRRLFEELVAELFLGFGFEVELTARTRDGGKDVIAVRRDIVRVRYLIECKRPDPGGYVSVAPVRELLGVRADENATKAILATTARFSPEAKLIFERNEWQLEGRDFDGVRDWIRNYFELAK